MCLFFEVYGDHRELHVPTHSFPTRRSSDLDRLVRGLNGSLNDAQVTKLTASEAAMSGAVKNARLAAPHLQGSFFGSYGYDLPSGATGFTSFQVQNVGS